MPRSVYDASLGVWRERLAAPENVQRTAKELGVLFGVDASTVQYWRHKVADADRPEAAPVKSSHNFLPVVVKSASSVDAVVVRLPGEVTISVHCDATLALVTLMNQLRSQAS